MNKIQFPYDYIPDKLVGRPLFDADLYFGIVDLDPEIPANQIDVYGKQEDGSSVLLPQPINTGSGGVPLYNGSPVELLIDELNYSFKALNRTGSQIYYAENVAAVLTSTAIEDFISVIENVAALASTPVVAGRTYYLKEYNAGTGFGGGELVGVAGSTTYDNVLTFAGSGGYFERINVSVIDCDMAGITGTDGSEGPRISAFFNACEGLIADMQGRDLISTTSISSSVTDINIINPGKITFTGSPATRSGSFVSFSGITGRFILDAGLVIDANDWFAKGLTVLTASGATDAVIVIDSASVNDCKTDTDAAQLAAGIYVAGPAKLVKIISPAINNVDHSLLTTNAARGVMVGVALSGWAERVIIIDPSITSVGPSNDGDGIFVEQTTGGSVNQNTVIVRGVFTNCAKRAIKTQSKFTRVVSPTIVRTQDFAVTTGGQVEIDIQSGNGVIENPAFRYHAATAYPATGLFTLGPERGAGANANGVKVLGGSCSFTNPASRTVEYLALLNSYDAADVNNNSEVSNFTFNGVISKCPFLFRPIASATFGFVSIKDFVACGNYFENIIGDVNAAFIWRDRSGSSYANSDGIVIRDNIVRSATQDVTTSYAVSTNTAITYGNVTGNYRVAAPEAYRLEPNFGLQIPTAQNSTFTRTVLVPFNCAVRVTFSYVPGGHAAHHLYLDAVVTLGNDAGEDQTVSIVSLLTQADSGTISLTRTFVVGSGWNLVFAKTAGTGALTGNGYIYIQSCGLGRLQ